MTSEILSWGRFCR